ncbi:unnamed protein product [Colias eurytheme]|nr:unnamed protein product [Colias eurytheme]
MFVTACGGLARYTPSKTRADHFQLGLSRTPHSEDHSEAESAASTEIHTVGCEDGVGEGEAGCGGDGEGGAGDVRPCAAETARSWSEARTHATDLLF